MNESAETTEEKKKSNISDEDYSELIRMYDVFDKSSTHNQIVLDIFLLITSFSTLIFSLFFITKIIPITDCYILPYITVLLSFLSINGILYSYYLCLVQSDYYTTLICKIMREDDNISAQKLLNISNYKYYTLIKIVNNFNYIVTLLGFSLFIITICTI